MDDIKDVVPGLLKRIQEDFQKQYKADKVVNEILFKQRSKMATYKEANEFSIRVGEMLANSFSKFLTTDSLPDGRMYYNIATRILEPTLHTNYSLITDVCKAAQTKINKDAGIGLKVIKPAFNKDRLKGLEDKVSNAEQFEDVQWVLKEPVVNFSQSIVDDSIKDNAEFHYKSGLTPKIRRTAESGCCKWCANLEGEYEYPYVPSNVYRKHENCRCVVEYIKDGKYTQNVHSKQWVGDVPPQERQKQILKQEKANQAATKRENEKQAVQALMKAHPEWTEEGATIYYRTNVAPNLYPETRQERIEVLNSKNYTNDVINSAFYKRQSFNTIADPMEEVFGPGETSNPEELKSFRKEAENAGVKIVERDQESLGYSPGLRKGEPGTLYVSKGASYSAWLHEITHMRDDQEAGWSGYQILTNLEEHQAREERAYMAEIDLALKMNRPDIAEKLYENMLGEFEKIYGKR